MSGFQTKANKQQLVNPGKYVIIDGGGKGGNGGRG